MPVNRVSRFGLVNSYLVEEEDGLTVIDTMVPRSAKSILAAAETRTVVPGERVGSLEVIASPGHTPGHVSLLDVRDRTLYAGDAYSTVGGVATATKGPLRFPLVSIATWHKPTALESAKALRALEPARLAPGHGKVIESPGAAMDAAIRRSE